MKKISPWLTLIIGYVLGYVLYPMLQMWTCHCDSINDIPIEAYKSYPDRSTGLISSVAAAPRVSSAEFVRRYLDPGAASNGLPSPHSPQRLGRPRTLSGEYHVQKRLFVAVITAESYLATRARAVYDTWGGSVTRVMFFVGEDCNTSHPSVRDLPIVKLPGIPDKVYPPQKKVFAVLNYIYDHYINDYQWFMRSDDDVYIRGEKLENLLANMDYNERVYLGLAGKGKAEDVKRLGLQPHEHYCMGGPGVVLSKAALRDLAPNLDLCLRAVDRYNEENPDNPWYNEDVELGRCVSRSINVQCSTSAEGRSYFIQDYTSAALKPQSLWQAPTFKNLITLHPIKQPENLYAVHHYYEVTRAQMMQEKLREMESTIRRMCDKMPTNLAPPWQMLPSCSLQMCSGGWARVGVASNSAPITMATKLPTVHNPQSVYELVPWTHFSTSTTHSVTGLSPEHGLYASLHSEIAGVVGLIEYHLNTVHSAGAADKQGLKPVEVIQGYTRFSEEAGREYILEIMFVEVENETRVHNKRVRLLRPLSPDITMVMEDTTTSDTIVNIILPLSTADDGFRHFMEWYYRTALHGAEYSVHLILCVVGDTKTLFRVQSLVANLTKLQPRSRTTILAGTPNLSPAGAVELGVSILTGKDLVFLADTTLRIRSFFFHSCRTNTLPGSKVYFPAPYVMFEEPVDYPGPGRWGFYHHSLVCIYKSDLLKFSVSPGNLFSRVSGSDVELFQAPEPGLIKVGVAETCERGGNDADREVHCEESLMSAQLEPAAVDYLYHHDQTNHISLSFIDLL